MGSRKTINEEIRTGNKMKRQKIEKRAERMKSEKNCKKSLKNRITREGGVNLLRMDTRTCRKL